MEFITKIMTFVKKHMKVLLFAADMVAYSVALFLVAFLKFDGSTGYPDWFKDKMFIFILIDFAVTMISFVAAKIYRRMWQYFVMRDYIALFVSYGISKLITVAVFTPVWWNYTRSFLTFIVLFCIMLGIFITGVRASVLVTYHLWRTRIIAPKLTDGRKKRVMIIGAGGAASRLVSELKSMDNVNSYDVVAFIDDNPRKIGEYLHGVKVYGDDRSIIKTAKDLSIDEIYLAIPSASVLRKKEILDICKQTGCVLKTLPDLGKLEENKSVTTQLRKVDYTDLLGREQIKPDLSKAFELLSGQTVLVTGGGGSIGGELVRQIAASGAAKRIIIFDIAENGAYDIQQEIKRRFPEVDLRVLIGSVRDIKRLEEVFEEYRPNFVYHAAAHKHVPLMEDSPKEAVKNNVFGTYNLAMTADKFGVRRFVMISTDKAVNPTNVMGATKRVCEMIVQSFNARSNTEFVCVRFGNVLGSNGSVIPLFKEQIEAGGPVTVTHPDIIRYFMLIPEAVSLVLEAGAFANGGEIFILDMGSPVKIKELAENMIRLSGHTPGVDIEIKYTGLRDGEKLYEELLISEEGIRKTQNDLIYVAKPTEFDSDELFGKLADIKEKINDLSRAEIIERIEDIVPTFKATNKEYNALKVKQ